MRLEDDKGEMPLHKLSRQGSMASVRALVERSAKVGRRLIALTPTPTLTLTLTLTLRWRR